MAADPKYLSTQELEQLIRSGSLPQSPRISESREQPISKSTAITLAMKSLQERISVLEDRNDSFSVQIRDKTDMIIRLEKDNTSLIDANRRLLEGKKSLEAEIALIKEAKHRETEQLLISEDHRKVLEAEIERNHHNFALDKEKFELEIQHLKVLIGERVESERNLIEMLKKATQDKVAAEADCEKLKKSLEDHRKRSENAQKSLESSLSKAESELSEGKKRSAQSIRDLERENKSQSDVIKAQKDTITRLRHEHAQGAKSKPINSARSTSRELTGKPPRKQSASVMEDGEEPVRERPVSARVGRDAEMEERQLEEHLSRCNSRYKELLQKSQLPGKDAKSARAEMRELAAEMETKSEALYAIKQQKIVRQ